jgi:hypothetical protein
MGSWLFLASPRLCVLALIPQTFHSAGQTGSSRSNLVKPKKDTRTELLHREEHEEREGLSKINRTTLLRDLRALRGEILPWSRLSYGEGRKASKAVNPIKRALPWASRVAVNSS